MRAHRTRPVRAALGILLLATACKEGAVVGVTASGNAAPVADAGADVALALRDTVSLDGSGSSDADGDPLGYAWSIVSMPAGSSVVLNGATTAAPTLQPDVAGAYEIELVVDDGTVASAPDRVRVTLARVPGIRVAADTVGAGLQTEATATLDTADHGGVTVRIESGDPSVLLVAPDAATPGGSFLEIAVPDGSGEVDFVLQGVAGSTGAASVTASSFVFDDGVGAVEVVEALAEIVDLGRDHGVGVPDSFAVWIGRGDGAGAGLAVAQGVSAAAAPALTLTLASSDGGVGEVAALGRTGAALTLDLEAGRSRVDAVFEPRASGSTTVSATVSGFVAGSVDVVVEQPGIETDALVIGAGLQEEGVAVLSTADHGGVALRIESGDPAVALVSADAMTPGAPFVEVPVADGDATARYVVQAAAGATGRVTLTISVPRFASGSGAVDVVPAGLSVAELASDQYVGVRDPFVVRAGPLDGAGIALSDTQAFSAANVPPLRMTATSSDGSVGRVIAGADTAALVDIDTSPLAAEYEVTFEPVSPGSTSVTVSVPGFATLGAPVAIEVDGPEIALFPSRTIGAGLQRIDEATLEIAGHGGVTVRVESDDPSVALVAPDAGTAGSAFVDVAVPDGSDEVPFVVQGVAGASGAATITATAIGFVAATSTVDVVRPGVAITALGTSQSVGITDAFLLLFGTPDGAGTGLGTVQGVSAANVPALSLTLSSSEGAVGRVSEQGGAADASVTLDLPSGLSQLSAAFTADAPGTTTVAVSVPGFEPVGGPVTVDVDAPLISLLPSRTIGAGLQRGADGTLGTADHGGVTVRIESSDPAVALVAPDAVTVGSAFIDVAVPDGSEDVPFVVQGVAGAGGTATVTATAPGFAAGTSAIDVVQPGVAISGLDTSQSVGVDDPFILYFGIPDAAGTGLASQQAVSAANVPALSLTLSSSDGAVGRVGVAGGAEDTSVTADLPAGALQMSGRFAPVGPGSTEVSASVPGFVSVNAPMTVDVGGPRITLVPSWTIGAALERSIAATLGIADHGGVTVRVETSDPSIALVAPDMGTPGSASIDVTVADGIDDVPIVLQGVAGASGSATVTVTAPGFAAGTTTVDVVQPGVVITALGGGQSVGVDDPFVLYFGIPNAAGTALASQQSVSAANVPALSLTLSSGDGGVGRVSLAGGAEDASVTAELPSGAFQLSARFTPVGPGRTELTASVPGFVGVNSPFTVDVGSPRITLFPRRTIGAGLQRTETATLAIPDHGGVTVRVQSADPSIALIAPDASTAGSAFVDVVVPDGGDDVTFVVQGVFGATGSVAVTATAPGFDGDTTTVDVVQAGVTITSLNTTRDVGAVDPFVVYFGIPNPAGTGLQSLQFVSAANVPALRLTLSSSDGAVGLVSVAGGAEAASVTTDLVSGAFVLSASFDPVAPGTTTVTATVPGFAVLTGASVGVTVNP